MMKHPTRSFPRWRLVLAALLMAGAAACGSGEDDDPAVPEASSVEEAARADVAVLMMGNSHTVGAELPGRLLLALQAALPGRRVAVVVAPDSQLLDEHLFNPRTLALLDRQRWAAVVLQAQAYSSSGLYSYSTAEAEELVRRVRALGAVPVLYPEWARRGIDEAGRIWSLHTGIAGRAVACVAPIPQAWKEALAASPAPPLHAADGNHAAAAGAQLTALVLQAMVTGIEPTVLPDLPGGGSPSLQRPLRDAAARALAAHPPRQYCPGDPLIR